MHCEPQEVNGGRLTLCIDEFGDLRDIGSCCNAFSCNKHNLFWFKYETQTLQVYAPMKQRLMSKIIIMEWYDIHFCPFCGAEIVVEKVSSDDYIKGDVIQ